MIQIHSIKYLIFLSCSIILNVLSINYLIFGGGNNWEYGWTKRAAKEAEVVASISCSGHGRAFLDGNLGVDGKPICECNACFTGPYCSHLIPNCTVDADSGDPLFLEPFWVKHAASSALVVPGWHRMSYEFKDGSLISDELETHIRKLHEVVGNANTDGRYIIFGAGATHLLNAAVHALSFNDRDHPFPTPSRVLASVPYYPVYKEQTEFFDSKYYKFDGDTLQWKNKIDSSRNYLELVTSPNNPDGQLKKAVLDGSSVKTVHDLAYYWPHFTAIPAPANEDLMIFTLSKLTGHAGTRFGWAIIRDEAVYKRMLTYMSLSTYGVARETQLRVLKLLKVALQNSGREMFYFGSKTMRNRWKLLTKVLSKSKRFSLQQIDHQHCSFFKKSKGPSPAFAWLKCEREEETDCYQVLKDANIIGREGSLFGDDSRFVRLSLVKSEDDFDLLLNRLEMLVRQELDQTLNSQESREIRSTNNGSVVVTLGGTIELESNYINGAYNYISIKP